VGSSLACGFERHGAEAIGPSHADVDLTDAAAVARGVAGGVARATRRAAATLGVALPSVDGPAHAPAGRL
jgi:hypothetical protein